MGAVAALLLGVLAIILGIGVAILGVVLIALSASGKRKAGCAAGAVILVLGCLLLGFPLFLFGGILLENTVIPEDFMNTDIVVEGEPYRDGGFYADGIYYVELREDAYYAGCRPVAEAVFAYKPDGILNQSQWHNFYRLENAGDFDLIWNGEGRLYCPEEQVDALRDYYMGRESYWNWVDWENDDDKICLPPEAQELLDAFMDNGNPSVERIPGAVDRSMVLHEFSDDYLMILDSIYLIITEDGIYLNTETIIDEDGNGTNFGIRLPAELEEHLENMQ